jgi:hypothetical protein
VTLYPKRSGPYTKVVASHSVIIEQSQAVLRQSLDRVVFVNLKQAQKEKNSTPCTYMSGVRLGRLVANSDSDRLDYLGLIVAFPVEEAQRCTAGLHRAGMK